MLLYLVAFLRRLENVQQIAYFFPNRQIMSVFVLFLRDKGKMPNNNQLTNSHYQAVSLNAHGGFVVYVLFT